MNENTTDTGWESRYDSYCEYLTDSEIDAALDSFARQQIKDFIRRERELVEKEAYERGYYEGEKNEFHNQAGRMKEAYERGRKEERNELLEMVKYELSFDEKAYNANKRDQFARGAMTAGKNIQFKIEAIEGALETPS